MHHGVREIDNNSMKIRLMMEVLMLKFFAAMLMLISGATYSNAKDWKYPTDVRPAVITAVSNCDYERLKITGLRPDERRYEKLMDRLHDQYVSAFDISMNAYVSDEMRSRNKQFSRKCLVTIDTMLELGYHPEIYIYNAAKKLNSAAIFIHLKNRKTNFDLNKKSYYGVPYAFIALNSLGMEPPSGLVESEGRERVRQLKIEMAKWISERFDKRARSDDGENILHYLLKSAVVDDDVLRVVLDAGADPGAYVIKSGKKVYPADLYTGNDNEILRRLSVN